MTLDFFVNKFEFLNLLNEPYWRTSSSKSEVRIKEICHHQERCVHNDKCVKIKNNRHIMTSRFSGHDIFDMIKKSSVTCGYNLRWSRSLVFSWTNWTQNRYLKIRSYDSFEFTGDTRKWSNIWMRTKQTITRISSKLRSMKTMSLTFHHVMTADMKHKLWDITIDDQEKHVIFELYICIKRSNSLIFISDLRTIPW